MSRFFKKTLSFFGISDEDEIDLDETEGMETEKVKVRTLRDKSGKIDSVHEKENPGRGHIFGSKTPRKISSIDSGRDGIKSRVFIAEPKEFEEIQIIADNFKDNIPVIINLQKADQELGKRVIDFCSGLTYALEGNIKKVAEKVFLITPFNVEVNSEEKELLREEGFYDHF
ncbi:MAG: cell division protein SepF [Actinomycetota bacterium]|nr:cell division protein SepF [Actinomycetota bacterium]